MTGRIGGIWPRVGSFAAFLPERGREVTGVQLMTLRRAGLLGPAAVRLPGREAPDDARLEILAAGTLPRCPHPDQPPLWYLPAGSLTCGDCTGALLWAADAKPACCQICAGRATAIAAWVIGDVPCFSHLCEECQQHRAPPRGA